MLAKSWLKNCYLDPASVNFESQESGINPSGIRQISGARLYQ